MRKRFYPILIPVFCLLIPFCSNAFAAERSALVLAAFGSSRPEAVKSIESFAESLRRERPDLKIVRAFTSPEIVEKLRDGEFETPDAAEAISALAAEGYNKIGVLALYVTPGRGYNELLRTAERLEGLEGGRVKMRVSPPLLGSEADAFSLASYLIYSLPGEIKPGEAVIFAGRGAENPGSLAYPALNWALFLQGEKGSLYMVVNLENRESVDQAMRILKLNRRKVVWLVPLMSVNGIRAAEEIFGNDEDSLASRLKDAGHTVRPCKQGLVSNPSAQTMWKARLKKMLPPPADLPRSTQPEEPKPTPLEAPRSITPAAPPSASPAASPLAMPGE